MGEDQKILFIYISHEFLEKRPKIGIFLFKIAFLTNFCRDELFFKKIFINLVF